MRLSTRGKYALQALVYLGYAGSGGELLSLSAIGRETGISDGYMEHIFKLLKDDGIVTSKKGKYGGYSLARTADKITVGDILLCVEGPLSLVQCAESGTCERSGWCPTHKVWEKAYAKIKKTTGSITLEALIKDYASRCEKAEAL